MSTSAKPAKSNHHARKVAIRWIKRGLLALVGAAGIGAIVVAWLPKPLVIDIGAVRRGSLDVEIEEDGRTRVRDRFVVAAPISGELARVELEAGATVTRGQVLARIAPPPPMMLDARSRAEAQARLAAALAHQRQAETAIERARAGQELAAKDAERSATLLMHSAITATEHERTALAARVAASDLAGAELARTAAAAEVVGARAALGDGHGAGVAGVAEVTAPIDGRVLRIDRESAGPIAAGAPLFEVGDPRVLEVVVDVLSSDAPRLAIGAPVTIEQWGGDLPLRGKVRLIEPAAYGKISALGIEEQRVDVIVTLDAPPPALGDGFRVEAHLQVWHGDDVVLVPASAVVRDRGGWAVYVVIDGRAVLRTVELGHRGKLDVEVRQGVAAGDPVVLHPSDRIADGVRVAAR
ncbi:MAG: efflux RND transporter periplasmic adaptor subunit [Deltaproteobacteria bacterium]|nr:efflux RND transporter periplasmic adaptor subunit [Deltaproteobacteria bacterium]